jgi:hypothetical protein
MRSVSRRTRDLVMDHEAKFAIPSRTSPETDDIEAQETASAGAALSEMLAEDK